MNAAAFRKLVTLHFSPKIRELGWKGSGFAFRKQEENHVVKIFGIQGSWMGGSVCCETAIHFDFIPDLAGQHFKKTTFASCMIRQRLSPRGEGDWHWNLKQKPEDNVISVNEIWEAFEKHGRRFYEDFDDFPAPFDSISVEEIKSDKNYRLLGKYFMRNSIDFVWMLKEINQFIGDKQKAKEFSEYGMQEVMMHAENMARDSNGKVGRIDTKYIENYRNLFSII